jgi:DNA-binding transcriptional ArsR family regulator
MPKPVSKKKKSEADAAAAAAAAALQKIEEASVKFKALGDPTRLRIVLFLQSAAELPFDKGNNEPLVAGEDAEAGAGDAAGPDAVTVGAIAFHLTGTDKVSSNISHHIKELRHAGLIAMKRRGKNILCRVEQDALGVLESVLCSSKDNALRQALASGGISEKGSSKKRQAGVSEG